MTVVVLVGGIGLSVASMMAVASVTAAVLMQGASDGGTVPVVLALGLATGAVNGALIVATRVPDIVVTLAMLFVWEGVALLILQAPGGAATPWLRGLIVGSVVPWVPRSLMFLLVCLLVVWLPLRRSKLGLSIYAVGSDPLAAYRPGVGIGPTRVAAYAICGAPLRPRRADADHGHRHRRADPRPLPARQRRRRGAGGVVLGGGVGGLLGPILAVFILRLVRMDLTLAAVDPNVTTIVEGTIMVPSHARRRAGIQGTEHMTHSDEGPSALARIGRRLGDNPVIPLLILLAARHRQRASSSPSRWRCWRPARR